MAANAAARALTCRYEHPVACTEVQVYSRPIVKSFLRFILTVPSSLEFPERMGRGVLLTKHPPLMCRDGGAGQVAAVMITLFLCNAVVSLLFLTHEGY